MIRCLWVGWIFAIVLTPCDARAKVTPATPLLRSSFTAEGGSAVVVLTFENRGAEAMLVLTSAFVVEGERPGEGNYFYVPPGGERKENVLEFVRRDQDWPGILGHPVRYLDRKDLERIVKVEPRSKVSFRLRWDEGLKISNLTWGLRVRGKILYLRLDGKQQAWRSAVQARCPFRLPESFPTAADKAVLDVAVESSGTFTMDDPNPCREALSALFEDVFSEDVLIPSAPER